MLILDDSQIKPKVVRICYQIFEDFLDKKNIYLLGIKNNGYKLSEKISHILKKEFNLAHKLEYLEIDKHDQIVKECSLSLDNIEKKNIIVVDDVLNTGRTMINITKYLLDISNIESLKTVVLVDRDHKKFPINADYRGISLSTSLNNVIDVVLEQNGKIKAYLK